MTKKTILTINIIWWAGQELAHQLSDMTMEIMDGVGRLVLDHCIT